MLAKTIPLNLEGCEALSRQKRPDQTYSEVIKVHLDGRTTAADFLRLLADVRLSEATLDAIDELIRARGESPAQAADV